MTQDSHSTGLLSSVLPARSFSTARRPSVQALIMIWREMERVRKVRREGEGERGGRERERDLGHG